MNYEVVKTTIETHVQALLAAYEGLVFGNDPIQSEPFDKIIRCTTQFGRTVQRSLGVRCFRTVGILYFQIMVRPGVGTVQQDQIADILVADFASLDLPVSSVSVTKIQFTDQTRVSDSTERNGWVTDTVSMAFYYDSEI